MSTTTDPSYSTDVDDTRRSKRAREESASPEVIRHQTLWFEDGNIILRAGNTLFRVHRSIVSRSSELFRDLFNLAQRADAETIEGAPVVDLHDSPLELADLLDVLYNNHRSIKHDFKPQWVTVQSMLQLGTKYGFKELRDTAMNYLKQIYPSFTSKNLDSADRAISFESADIISMANLARSIRIPIDIRLRALYSCCQLPTEQLLFGIFHSRGYMDRLAEDDVIRCVDARLKLCVASAKMVHDLCNNFRKCPHGGPCRTSCKTWYNRVASTELVCNPHPLGFPTLVGQNKECDVLAKSLCHDCREAFSSECTAYKQRIDTRLWKYISITDQTV